MFEIKLALKKRQIDRLAYEFGRFGKRSAGKHATILNRSARFGIKYMTELIRKEVQVKVKDVKFRVGSQKKQLYQSKKANRKKPHARIQVNKYRPPGLQHYGAKQNKRGVTYKISKKEGRKLLKSAFMGPYPGAIAVKLRGGVWIRTQKARYPIARKRGPSIWAVVKKNRLKRKVQRKVNKQIHKEMKLVIRKMIYKHYTKK